MAADSWFDDVERYTNLWEIRLDVAGPESARFTALRVAPFIPAQAPATGDMGLSAAKYTPEQEGEFSSGLWLTKERRFRELKALVSRATGTPNFC